MSHTPLPWKVRTLREDCFVEGNQVVGKTIAGEYKREILSDEDYPEKLWDAHFIVNAVNNFEDLVSSCKALIRELESAYEELDTDEEEREVLNIAKERLGKL